MLEMTKKGTFVNKPNKETYDYPKFIKPVKAFNNGLTGKITSVNAKLEAHKYKKLRKTTNSKMYSEVIHEDEKEEDNGEYSSRI